MSDPSQPSTNEPATGPAPENKAVEHDAEVPPRPVTPIESPDPADTALADLARTAEATWKSARRWVIFVVGVSIVLFGLVVGILPGVPGIPIMFLGFALLATEFIWARKILKRLKQEALALKAKAERAMGLTPSTPSADAAHSSDAANAKPGPHAPPRDPHDQRGAA
ncbi:MAG: PGPGW domain-containing protein [Phycisphaerales bacterium]|nr:PGPGW domain-containing protein [Phycisphaerales bacterium]